MFTCVIHGFSQRSHVWILQQSFKKPQKDSKCLKRNLTVCRKIDQEIFSSFLLDQGSGQILEWTFDDVHFCTVLSTNQRAVLNSQNFTMTVNKFCNEISNFSNSLNSTEILVFISAEILKFEKISQQVMGDKDSNQFHYVIIWSHDHLLFKSCDRTLEWYFWQTNLYF